MISMGANPLLGPLERWALKISTFWGQNGPRMDFPPQNHYVPRHINNRYINSYYIPNCRQQWKRQTNAIHKQTKIHYLAGKINIFI